MMLIGRMRIMSLISGFMIVCMFGIVFLLGLIRGESD